MSRDVIVSVSGTQFYVDDQNPIEVVSTGKCYRKNGKTYIKYEESDEDNSISKCTIKVSDDCVEITKKGAYTSCMVFKKDKNCMTTYDTPFGNLVIGITTEELIVIDSGDAMVVKIKYALDINYEFVSNCSVDIKVLSVQGTEEEAE